MISRLYNKWSKLRDLLATYPSITHLELLKELEQGVAREYEKGLNIPFTVYERFNMLDKPLFGKSKQGRCVSKKDARAVLQSQNIFNHESVIDAIEHRRDLCPIQALEELQEIKDATIHVLPRNLVAIENNKIVAAERLAHLSKIDLRGCHEITQEHLRQLEENCLWLESLNLSGVRNISTLGRANVLGVKPLNFMNLLKLCLNECERLQEVNLHVPQLIVLEAQNCPLLRKINLGTLTHAAQLALRIIDVRSDDLLTDDVLDGLLKQCPFLQTLYVNGCSNISFKDVRHLCPTFPTHLLKQLSQKHRELIVAYCIMLLKQNPWLTTLHLGIDRIDDSACEALCCALQRNTIVKSLYLGANPITDRGIAALAAVVRAHKSIENIDLGDTLATQTGMKLLLAAIGANRTIKDVQWHSRAVQEEQMLDLNDRLCMSLPQEMKDQIETIKKDWPRS